MSEESFIDSVLGSKPLVEGALLCANEGVELARFLERAEVTLEECRGIFEEIERDGDSDGEE